MTGRRAFLAFIAAGLSLAPAPARGQRRAKVSRVGVLSPFDPSDDAFLEVFRQGLRELGHVEGQNLTIEASVARGPKGESTPTRDTFARRWPRAGAGASESPAAMKARNARRPVQPRVSE